MRIVPLPVSHDDAHLSHPSAQRKHADFRSRQPQARAPTTAMRAGPRRRQGRTATTPACSPTGQGSPSPQVTGGVARMGEKVRMLSSCRLRCWWPFVLLSAGLSTWVWSQPASIRTFHRWLRVQRFGWSGATPRSAAMGIGRGRVDHQQRQGRGGIRGTPGAAGSGLPSEGRSWFTIGLLWHCMFTRPDSRTLLRLRS